MCRRNWEVTQLRRVIQKGSTITYGIVQAGPHVEDGVPYIKTSDMSGAELPIEGYSKTSTEIDAAYARSRVEGGDLVIAIRASVGKCLQVPPSLSGANLTQGTAKIAPGDHVSGEFLLAYINSTPVQAYLDSRAKGATFKEITLDTLRRTPVLLPSAPEQRAISEKIKEANRTFGQLIADAERAIALLQERRTTLISAAVTGKIDVRDIATAEAA
jgi:type I restriction enzyme S subunit